MDGLPVLWQSVAVTFGSAVLTAGGGRFGSVAVIVAVNLAAEYGTLAAAIATAPTGAPLSLGVMVQQVG